MEENYILITCNHLLCLLVCYERCTLCYNTFWKMYFRLLHWINNKKDFHYFFLFFLVRLSILRAFFSSLPHRQWRPISKDFYTRCFPLHLFLLSWFLKKRQYFPFECSVLNKGTTGTIFIKYFWYDAVLDCGLNPWPSHNRSQHCTTRLSWRRSWLWIEPVALPQSKPALYH